MAKGLRTTTKPAGTKMQPKTVKKPEQFQHGPEPISLLKPAGTLSTKPAPPKMQPETMKSPEEFQRGPEPVCLPKSAETPSASKMQKETVTKPEDLGEDDPPIELRMKIEQIVALKRLMNVLEDTVGELVPVEKRKPDFESDRFPLACQMLCNKLYFWLVLHFENERLKKENSEG